jgi:hypothetical protein
MSDQPGASLDDFSFRTPCTAKEVDHGTVGVDPRWQARQARRINQWDGAASSKTTGAPEASQDVLARKEALAKCQSLLPEDDRQRQAQIDDRRG